MVMVRACERQIAANDPDCDALSRAMVVVATMIGTLAVARGAARGNPAVSDQVLQASRRVLDELMLTDTGDRRPVLASSRPSAVKSIS